MSNNQKPSFSLNSAGSLSNSTGSYFQRIALYEKSALANQEFGTSGLGGSVIGIPWNVSPPATLDLAGMTGGGTSMWAIGNGKLEFNRMQIVWSQQDTSLAGLSIGYMNAGTGWPNTGNADIDSNFVRLGSTLTSSSTAFGIKYEDQTISFTPAEGQLYCFGMFNDTGSLINRLNGIITFSTKSTF